MLASDRLDIALGFIREQRELGTVSLKLFNIWENKTPTYETLGNNGPSFRQANVCTFQSGQVLPGGRKERD